MRKIVDSNYLQNIKLASYLSSSSSNYIVLTDYVAMESYKGDTLNSIYKSMSILSSYPKQVIVLKGTQDVCGLKNTSKGMQKRLIDKKQTKEFHVFCKQIKTAEAGSKIHQSALLEHGSTATEQMDKLLLDADGFIEAISETANSYSQEELRIFRSKDKTYTKEMIDKIIQHILKLTSFSFDKHPKISKKPSGSTIYNFYIFRYSVSCYLLVLDWISHGGASGSKSSRIRNDMVDMSFVTYATFFDGILTNDKKAIQIYNETSFLLQRIFKA